MCAASYIGDYFQKGFENNYPDTWKYIYDQQPTPK